MEWTAARIAEITGGTLEGDPSTLVTRTGSLDKAVSGAVSFFYDPKYIPHLYGTRASVVILPADFQPETPLNCALIRTENPYQAFNKVLHAFYEQKLPPSGIEPYAVIPDGWQIGTDVYVGSHSYISSGVKVGMNVKIFPGCFIGRDCVIGDNVIIYPNVTLYHEVTIGNNCIIHSGAVIGSDGFGFLKDENGVNIKIPQIGRVVIEDEVEIGANTVIDRSTLDDTVIKKGVKLDNLVQVAHNTEIGEQTVIAAQAGLSGGTVVGKNCMIGGQVGTVGHLSIADRSQIGGQAGITKSLTEPGKMYRGAPAHELKQQLKYEALIRKLPELLNRIETLEKMIQNP